jgi:hypothetical protein
MTAITASNKTSNHNPTLRFTTRDLLWLMAVAGLSVGWWISLAKAPAAWHREREQIYVEWRKERVESGALHLRISTGLSKLPTAEREELFRTIYGGVKAIDKHGPPATPNHPSPTPKHNP